MTRVEFGWWRTGSRRPTQVSYPLTLRSSLSSATLSNFEFLTREKGLLKTRLSSVAHVKPNRKKPPAPEWMPMPNSLFFFSHDGEDSPVRDESGRIPSTGRRPVALFPPSLQSGFLASLRGLTISLKHGYFNTLTIPSKKKNPKNEGTFN